MSVTDLKAREASAPPLPEETPTPIPGYTIELSKPIEAHGQQITKLVFREPTGRDLLNVGNPVIFDPISDPPKVVHDERRETAGPGEIRRLSQRLRIEVEAMKCEIGSSYRTGGHELAITLDELPRNAARRAEHVEPAGGAGAIEEKCSSRAAWKRLRNERTAGSASNRASSQRPKTPCPDGSSR